MTDLRFRQIHLDFHTSELIPGIGSQFDADKFVATLKAARVDSVTCFSRCHHGWIYHPTKFPLVHPKLAVPDLLPTTLQASLTHQGARHILHLLHYVPERRGLNFDIVEDGLPMHELTARVRVQATKATLAPAGVDLAIRQDGDYAELTIPPFTGHCMIALEPARGSQ